MRNLGHKVKLASQAGDKTDTITHRLMVKLGFAEQIEETHEITLKNGVKLKATTEDLEVDTVVMTAENAVVANGTYELSDGNTFEVEDTTIVKMGKVSAKVNDSKTNDKAQALDVVLSKLESLEKQVAGGDGAAKGQADLIRKEVETYLSKVDNPVPPSRQNFGRGQDLLLSRHELAAMTPQERANHYVFSGIQRLGEGNYREVKLASGEPTITTTYAGEYAAPFVGASLLSGDTLSNGYVRIHENVPLSGLAIQNLALANLLQAAGCDFTHQGTVTKGEEKLIPVDMKVNLEVCKTPHLTDWEAKSMGRGRMDKDLPPNFQSFFLQRIVARVAQQIETWIWQGDTGGSALFNGFDTLLNGQVQTGSAGAITSANVQSKMREAIALIPAARRFDRDLKLKCPGDIVQLYIESLGNAHYNDMSAVGAKPLNIDGYEIQYCPGKTSGTITICKDDDLHFGTDLVSDHMSVKLIDQEPLDGSENVHVVMKLTGGCLATLPATEVIYWENGAV